MSKLLVSLLLFFFVMLGFSLAQTNIPEIEPWEENISEFNDSHPNELKKPLFSIDWFMYKLISFYQKDISTQSISRCPFVISCSHYAQTAIENKGFLIGILYFIDRNQFRENAGIRRHYFIRELSAGVLRLDDSFYLYGSGN